MFVTILFSVPLLLHKREETCNPTHCGLQVS